MAIQAETCCRTGKKLNRKILLKQCQIWGFPGGDYEELRLLGFYACGSCKNRRFRGTQRLFHQVTRIGELGTTLAVTSNRRTLRRCSVRRLLVTANVPSSPILVTLMKEVLCSSETSVLTRATQRNISEDAILYFSNKFCKWNCVPLIFANNCTNVNVLRTPTAYVES
jgi:hypothetical protein